MEQSIYHAKKNFGTDTVGLYATELRTCEDLLKMGINFVAPGVNVSKRAEQLEKEIERIEKPRKVSHR